MIEHDAPQFSRLEASFGQTKVVPRQNSLEMKDVFRHAKADDLHGDDLEFSFSLDHSNYPLDTVASLQDVFSAAQHATHFSNLRNFSEESWISCFDTNGDESSLMGHTDSQSLSALLRKAANPSSPTPLGSTLGERSDLRPRRLLAFFVPLRPAKNTSFGSRIAMTQNNARELFRSLDVNPLYIMNLLGRPDYWAPQTRWESKDDGNFLACDFFCQHPRWNLHFQGTPLSVYMRYSAALNLTTHHHQNCTPKPESQHIPKRSVDIAVILSTLYFEASKFHAQRFRRFMWTQINKVDDHLAGLEDSDRRQLGELTKQLQIISQNADSHLGNTDVAIITASAIRTIHARLHQAISSPTQAQVHERAADSITYMIESMQKQKIWFLNYKNRKDSTMALVYNLVTQQDAASNIQIAASMKRDSTSMNAIAAMTMTFLPETFIATILDAGIFFAVENSTRIRVSGLWWLWIVLTIPLPLVVIVCWWWYKKIKGKVRLAPQIRTTDDEEDAALPTPSKTMSSRLANFRTWSRNDSVAGTV
ncbi:hypothetical protein BDW59DRAFT_156421 [Aspergillus cavernicola]|uniref:Uncharacterized protein n=1 Tax=Aspergillus cavernicola TaxID=176166 RepID=A0ABR4J3M5_9EURO